MKKIRPIFTKKKYKGRKYDFDVFVKDSKGRVGKKAVLRNMTEYQVRRYVSVQPYSKRVVQIYKK